MILSRSAGRKVVATLVAVVGFVLLYEVTTIDSRYAARQAMLRETTALPAPGARLRFSATAYCKGTVTASGVAPQSGVAAADPVLLPVGSVIQVAAESPYAGIYTIMDTGPMIQGRRIDIYLWSCIEARQFGRRLVGVTVLRLGWNPRASTPSLIDSFLNRGGPPAKPLLPAHPLPVGPSAPLR
jgi:3D (Asp-Asp-Asp) domain-containing protein